jgi:hypothetical protein
MLKLNFSTLTPLHISNGEQLGYGLDYIQKGNYIYKLNPQKVAQKLFEKNIFDFKKDYSLDEFLGLIKKYENSFNESDAFYVVEADKLFTKHIANERAIGRKYFIEFVNSNGKFYIPASSVKGAILTVLKTDHLGIDVKNADIADKFVIHDSDFIPSERMNVYLTNNRPPKVGLLCVIPNTNFSLLVTKYKSLNIDDLKIKLRSYASKQIELAKKYIVKFKAPAGRRPKGADIFYDALQNLESDLKKLKNDEYLINIGFGGGSYFKIFEGIQPYKFDNSRKDPKTKKKIFTKEEAHTTVSFNFSGRTDHIGWCKLKIEEE